MFKFALFFVFATVVAGLPSSTSCPQKNLEQIAANPQGWSIRKMNKDVMDEIICDEPRLKSYIECYLDGPCPDTEIFNFVKQQVLKHISGPSGQCKGCPPRARREIRRLMSKIREMGYLDAIVEKAGNEYGK